MKNEIKIKVGDMFDAYVKESKHSKSIFGNELAGIRCYFSPEKATLVTRARVESKDNTYGKLYFSFEGVCASPSSEEVGAVV